MAAQEEDVSISQMSTLPTASNYWEANEIVIKKEPDELDTVKAVGTRSDENRHLVAYRPIPKRAIKEELKDTEDQSQEINNLEEVSLLIACIYSIYLKTNDFNNLLV